MKVTLKYFLLVSKLNGQQHSLLENYAFLHRLHESTQAWCANEHDSPGILPYLSTVCYFDCSVVGGLHGMVWHGK